MKTQMRLGRSRVLVVMVMAAAWSASSAFAQLGVPISAPAALNTNAASDAGNDVGPQVTPDGAGNWVAVWYSNENLGGTIGTDTDILVSGSTDNGLTWSPPAPLNTNVASDAADDQFPQVTTDGAGNWVAVWESSENLSGTIGTDDDILVARFILPDCNGNGTPDATEPDSDGDGVIDACDNCPAYPNTGQAYPRADVDQDCDVDGVDFAKFAQCFNKAGNPPRTLGCPQN